MVFLLNDSKNSLRPGFGRLGFLSWVWAVEIRFLTVALKRHPRSVAFIDFTAKSDSMSAQNKFLGVGVAKRAASVFCALFMAYSGIEWGAIVKRALPANFPFYQRMRDTLPNFAPPEGLKR